MTFLMLAILIFDILVTVRKIFTVQMCMTLILTFLSGPQSDVNMRIGRPHATFFVGDCKVCPICHRLRDNHV